MMILLNSYKDCCLSIFNLSSANISLSLEFSENIADYLRKVILQINKSKLLAQEKLKRKVLFNSGIDFCDLNKYYGDVDKAKKGGIDEFKR